MPDQTDAFLHHPELREQIVDPLGSFFRDFDVEAMIDKHPELESARDWIHPQDERDSLRARTLAEHDSGDLWVFAFGSLMWDPAFHFAEVRRATVPGYSRHFILLDVHGGRGTKEAPGLMAALDRGGSCEGLAFRIRAEDVDTETEILWRREMIGPGYVPTYVTADLDGQSQTTLTFVADHAAEAINLTLTRADQIHLIANGAGILGSSKAYLANIVNHFETLGIVDSDCTALLQEVEDYLAAQ